MLYLYLNKHRKITFAIILSVHRSSISIHQFAPSFDSVYPSLPLPQNNSFLFPFIAPMICYPFFLDKFLHPPPPCAFLLSRFCGYSRLYIHKYERVNDDCLSWSG